MNLSNRMSDSSVDSFSTVINAPSSQTVCTQDAQAGLAGWGWTHFFSAAYAEWQERPELQPARIVAEYQGLYRFLAAGGEGLAELAGKLRHRSESRDRLPAVGDWVVLYWQPEMEHARIEAVLPRRSQFMRKSTGSRSEAQVVAANVDTVLLISALNQDLNVRRIERYLTLAWESGARPVIALSKADLAGDTDALRAEVEALAIGTDVVVISSLTGAGLEALSPWLMPGQTVALLGSSGVGKSTLVNTLSGKSLQTVQGIREDDSKGRHTTTHRELFRLPSGVLMLDTPGMRELQLWQAGEGLEAIFADIAADTERLATQCRYRNCAHVNEAGCAINAALATGELDAERYAHYLKLQREEAWIGRRSDKAAQASERKRWKQIHVQAREHMKYKYGKDD